MPNCWGPKSHNKPSTSSLSPPPAPPSALAPLLLLSKDPGLQPLPELHCREDLFSLACLLSMTLDLAYHLTLARYSLDCWLTQLSPLSLLCSPCPGPFLCWQKQSLVPLCSSSLNELWGQWEERVWAEAQVRLAGAVSTCWHAQGPDTKLFPSQSSNKALMSSHTSFKVIYWAMSK